ncbi:MAG: aldose 1-epimerase family protein, partial [Bacteroidota bacterium]
MTKIENAQLSAQITDVGIELASLIDLATGEEYIWQANPTVWGSHAPVLFPIIGGLKDGQYHFNGQSYQLPKHGMVRRNPNLQLVQHTVNSATFELKASEETRRIYPFEFTFRLTYRLEERTLHHEFEIINEGSEKMFFSLGGHPAFRVPLRSSEAYDDYHLRFAYPENAQRYVVNSNGLIAAETLPVAWEDNRLPLTHELFLNDALVFKDLQSREVTLVSKSFGDVLKVSFSDFSYL